MAMELDTWGASLRAAHTGCDYEGYLGLLAQVVAEAEWLAGEQAPAAWHNPEMGVYAWTWALPGDVLLGYVEYHTLAGMWSTSAASM